ncbi:MAG: TetR family transcriptional regulator [Alphaproteobacteria bacterium]|nr:TetR family transcriptional regulator [Alphaproteobacteria bacterium]
MGRDEIPGARPSTRGRILQAALRRFARHSYEDTRLRDIAHDVGVDVALVHRSFGSKERLFAEAIDAAFQPRRLRASERTDLAAGLARRVLEQRPERTLRRIDPLDIVIRSLQSRDAIPIIRTALAKHFVEPLAAELGDPTGRRAALIAACLAGVSIFRNVLRSEPLLEAAGGDLEALIARVVDTVGGERGPTRGLADSGALPDRIAALPSTGSG